jgi:predicted permease
MPQGFDFPIETELWVPRQPIDEARTAHNWRVVGRLRDGVSRAAAQEDLSTVARRLKQQYGDGADMVDADVRPVLDQLVGSVRPALSVLLGAAGVLLLVACVNVANLLLARALSREGESALRLALGARPARLVRVFLSESLVLSLAGGALGVLIALAGVPALLALEPGRLPRIQDIGVDSRVLVFSLTAAVLTAVAIGLVPGLRAAQRDMRSVLAGSRRIQGSTAAGRRWRGALVAGQIALTLVLLVGGGLLGRSFVKLLAVDPGYRTEGAIVMDLWHPAVSLLEAPGSPGDLRIAATTEALMARLRALPGVERVGGIDQFPLRSGGPSGTFLVLRRPDEVASFEDYRRLALDRARTGNAEFLVASPGYFAAMGIPLLRGRLFDTRDSMDAPHVAVISASLAKARWAGEDPLGKLIQFGGMDGDLRPFTIVGIVGDVVERSLGAAPRPMFYTDYRQRPRKAFEFHVVIQGRFDVAATSEAARRIARDEDPEMPIELQTLEDIVSSSLADRRFVLLLVALFGGLALMLATTGIYGVVSYVASQRTAEIGVRVALGAHAGEVVRLLVRQGIVFAGAGVAAGLVGAFALTRLLGSMLYGVGAADPATFVTAAVALLAAAVVASWIPAHRAARIDPVEAVRHE